MTSCTAVMGFRGQAEQYYADCQDSLMHSVTRKGSPPKPWGAAAHVRAATRELPQGAPPPFSVCMLVDQPTNQCSRPRHIAASAGQPCLPPSGALQGGKSYYSVTPAVQWQRERYSCAQLGLAPNSGLFGDMRRPAPCRARYYPI